MLVINAIQKKLEDCELCYKIKCRGCGWEPDEIQLSKVLNSEITVCPTCGRAP